MSTAWYKSGVKPSLRKRWEYLNNNNNNNNNTNKIVEVWNTTCIVTNFGKSIFSSSSIENFTTERDNNNNNNNNDDDEIQSHYADEQQKLYHNYHNILINPSNPNLSGVSKFPYFPKGGPVPTNLPSKDSHPIMGYVTTWGGMEVGNGMMFPANVVDGLVHQLGGWKLAYECQQIIQPLPSQLHEEENIVKTERNQFFPSSFSSSFVSSLLSKYSTYNNSSSHDNNDDTDIKCPIGYAVQTGPGNGSDLSYQYDTIIHTVPPFFKYPSPSSSSFSSPSDSNKSINPSRFLQECYQNSLHLATATSKTNNNNNNNNNNIRIACPLLGAGCRGFPIDIAIDIAANQAIQWLFIDDANNDNNNHDIVVMENNKNDNNNNNNIILAFGIPDSNISKQLQIALDRYYTDKKQKQ